MAQFYDFSDVLDEIAAKAYAGDYGDSPFDRSTEGGEQLFRDAYERVGVHDTESWFEGDNAGGLVVEAIHMRYDTFAIRDDVDNPFVNAFEIESREQMTVETAPPPKTMDDVILGADDKQQQVDLLVSRNEAKIADDKPITTISADTIEALKAEGVDVSALERQLGIDAKDQSDVEAPQEYENPFDALEALDDISDEYFSSSRFGDGEFVEIEPISGDANVEAAPAAEAVESPVATDVNEELDDHEDMTLEDFVFVAEDGSEISLKDILADACDSDDELRGILSQAVEIADRGDDPRPYMEDAIADYVAKHTAGADVENAGDDTDRVDNGESSSSDSPADSEAVKQKYQENFEKHSEKLEARKALPAQIRGDTFKAYHEMAKIYNACKGGIEIDGKVPTKVDVAISVLNFTRSNILETLVIDLIRSLVEKKEDDKDYVEVPEGNATSEPVDKYGIQENGDIAQATSPEEAKEIASYRGLLPEAGKVCGADMSKVDRGSTPDVTIRTTNPDGINGRGVVVTLDDAKKYTIPDVRLVDIKGERLLVDPFGKILEVVSDGDKYKVGQTLAGLDTSARGMGKDAIETYARDHGLTVDQAKETISHDVKERFCERVEDSYRVEAKAIEQTVIPRELEMRADLQSKLANIDNIARSATTPEDKETLLDMKHDLDKAIKTLDDRIDSLRSRQVDLERSGSKPSARSTNDRFADAVASEKRAVGRSVFTTDLGIDRGKIQERVSIGVEAIKARVEAHNATVPEKDRISYDSKTGDFVDRFGISDKGEYVGNSNGKFMDDSVSGPLSKDDEAKYIKEHMDPSRFDNIDKILDGIEAEQTEADVERPENEEVFGVENIDPVDTELVENNEVDNTANADTEVTEPNGVENGEPNVDSPDQTDIDNSNIEQNQPPEIEQGNPADVENNPGAEVENKDPSEVENQEASNVETAENTNVENSESNNVETPETNDTEVAEVPVEEIPEAEAVDPTEATEAAEAAVIENPEGESVETTTEEESDATELESTENNDEESSHVEAEESENSSVDSEENAEDTDNSEVTTSDNEDDNAEIESPVGTGTNDGVEAEADDVDDVDDVEASEEDGHGTTHETADIQSVDVKDAIEAQGNGAGNDDDTELDPTAANDGDVEADHDNDDDDKTSWVDDLKGHLDDYIEGCMKQFEDPIGYEADKIDREIDQICDLIEMFGGDVSGIREAAHELVSSAVEAITNAGDPTAQEAMKEAFSHLFEELGFKLEEPETLFNDLCNEYNDSIGTDNEELVDDLTDAYASGANAAEENYSDVDADFESVHLDEDTLVTQDGVVDEIGQTTGGIDDANAEEIERAINDATSDSVPQEIEQLEIQGEPASVEEISGANDVVVENIEAPDVEIAPNENLPEVDMNTGAEAVEGAESAGAEEMVEEIVEVLLI